MQFPWYHFLDYSVEFLHPFPWCNFLDTISLIILLSSCIHFIDTISLIPFPWLFWWVQLAVMNSRLLCWAAGRSRYSGLQSQCCHQRWSRSSSPSRLSRPRPWLSGGRGNRWWSHSQIHIPHNQKHTQLQCQMQWIVMRWSIPAQLVSCRSSEGHSGSCWGSLVRWLHLWHGMFNIEFKKVLSNQSPPLTLAATAFCRAKHQVYRLPESGSSCWVEKTSKAEPLWIRTLTAAAVVVMEVFIFAVVGFQVWAGAAGGGKAALW